MKNTISAFTLVLLALCPCCFDANAQTDTPTSTPTSTPTATNTFTVTYTPFAGESVTTPFPKIVQFQSGSSAAVAIPTVSGRASSITDDFPMSTPKWVSKRYSKMLVYADVTSTTYDDTPSPKVGTWFLNELDGDPYLWDETAVNSTENGTARTVYEVEIPNGAQPFYIDLYDDTGLTGTSVDIYIQLTEEW